MIKLSEYVRYDGLGLAELVRRGEVTPKELKDAALEGIAQVNPKLNAVHSVLANHAQKEIDAGLHDGPFQGVPFLIKDLVLHAAGIPVNSGSRLLQGLIFPHDTELMARFRKAGLVLVGTTTTPELGYNCTAEAVFYGPTHNPWNTGRSPGGSSGGSGAAVAARIVPLAHGNDGGGSIRIPSSCCGIFGLKPTRGRTPLGPDSGEAIHGLGIDFALTRSVRDAAALMDAVAGPDPGAPNWAEPPSRLFLEEVSTPPRRLRIAWTAKPASGVPVDREVVDALHGTVKLCEELGHELVEAAPTYDVEGFMAATVCIWSANVAHIIEAGAAAVGRTPSEQNLEATSWATYRYGNSLKASELLQALDVYARVSRMVGQFFQNYDLLLTPTIAHLPAPLGELNANAPGVTAEQWTMQLFTYTPFTLLYNVTGQPAMSVPLAWSREGLPIGMQFAGRFAAEAKLFRLAAQLEQARPWKDKLPPVHV
jgi:amidase